MGDRRIRFQRGQGLWLLQVYKMGKRSKTTIPVRYEDASFSVLFEKAGRLADMHSILRDAVKVDDSKMTITIDVSTYYREYR